MRVLVVERADRAVRLQVTDPLRRIDSGLVGRDDCIAFLVGEAGPSESGARLGHDLVDRQLVEGPSDADTGIVGDEIDPAEDAFGLLDEGENGIAVVEREEIEGEVEMLLVRDF